MARPAALGRCPLGSAAASAALLTILRLLLGLPSGAAAQDWSGASLRGAQTLALPEGYQARVLARGLRLPQDLAVDPPDGLWVLTRGAPGRRGAGALVRIPLDAPGPIDASQLPGVLIPFASSTAPFEVGSMVRHPGSGDLYVAEARGRHVFRVAADGRIELFARGGQALGEGRALAFDTQGWLLVLDFAGRSAVADATTDALRELLGPGEAYEGPVIHRLRVDEALPLPRNLEHARSAFPPPAVRRRAVILPRYHSLALLSSGELVANTGSGQIDQVRPDGTVARLAAAPGSHNTALVAGEAGVLYALDNLGGRIIRVQADRRVETFAEGLTRPMALAVLPDGTLLNFFNEILNFKNSDKGTKFDFNLAFIQSTNQGATWSHGQPTRAAKIQSLALFRAFGVVDPDGLAPTGVRTGDVLFDVAVDLSPGSPGLGNVYAVWQNARFSGFARDEIAFAMSTDGGVTWSAPVKINQTPASIPSGNRQAFTPSVHVSADGSVGVTYYDFRNNTPDPATLPTDYFIVHCHQSATVSCANPANWGGEVQLTDVSFDMRQAPLARGFFTGDYEGLTASVNKFGALFSMPHSTDPASVFFRRVGP